MPIESFFRSNEADKSAITFCERDCGPVYCGWASVGHMVLFREERNKYTRVEKLTRVALPSV